MKKVTWTQKNGQEIAVDDMTPDHAENTIKMLIRNNGANQVLKAALFGQMSAKKIADAAERRKNRAGEITLNGEAAQLFHDLHEEDHFENYYGDEIHYDPYWD